jgi:hypothetical protein
MTAGAGRDVGPRRVAVRVENPGDGATTHVAQAYLELDGFDDGAGLVVVRVALGPGERADAEVVVGSEAFERYDPDVGRRAVVDGWHLLGIGVHALDEGETVTVQVAGVPSSVSLGDGPRPMTAAP